MSRRTGRLVLLPQVVLADLEAGLPAEVLHELRARVAPILPEFLEASGAEVIGRALLDLADEDVADFVDEAPNAEDENEGPLHGRVFSGGPFTRYTALGVGRGVLQAVARLNVRGQARGCRLAGPVVEGGGEYVYDVDAAAWSHAPIPAEELLTPVARTFGLAVELTPGGLGKCTVVPPTADAALPDEAALTRLSTKLRPRVEELIGGASLLERDPLAGIAILVTTLSTFLARPELSRKDKKDRPCVRADLYEALLDSLVLGEDRETVRRIVEAHHPQHIELQVQWPSGASDEGNQSVTLLDRRGEHLVLRLGRSLPKAPPRPASFSFQGLPDMATLKNGNPPLSPDLLSRSRSEGEREKVGGDSSPKASATLARGPSGPLASVSDGLRHQGGGSGEVAAPALPPPRKAVVPKVGPSSGLPPAWVSREAVEDIQGYRGHLQTWMLTELLASIPPGTALGLVEREARRVGVGGTKDYLSRDRGLKAATVNKYVDAATKLERYLPGVYADALRAIVNDEPIPELPAASRLVLIPRMTIGLRGEEVAEKVALLLFGGVPESVLRELEEASVGGADARESLRELETGIRSLGEAEVAVKRLLGLVDIPTSRLPATRILHDLREGAERLARVARDAGVLLGEAACDPEPSEAGGSGTADPDRP